MVSALGAVVRFAAIGSIPFGLYQDEAFNGLDALRVLSGTTPLYFTTNNGREPLFIYLISLSIAWLGRTPAAVRLPAAFLGTAIIPVTALLGKRLFNNRVGVVAGVLAAFTFWSIHLSRISFRAIGLPLMIGLSLAVGWHGARTGRKACLIAGGIFYGLGFYTYLPIYFTLPVLALLTLFLWATGRQYQLMRAVPWFLLGAGSAFLPLGLYAFSHHIELLGRTAQVSILNQDGMLGVLVKQTTRSLGMYFWRGDIIPRHNLPGRPVFDPLTAVFLLPGLAWIVRNWRKPAAFLTLTWSVCMLAPTILAEDAPHFLRSVGVLPVAFIIPAIGMEQTWKWIENKKAPRWTAPILITIVLLFGLASTANDYFRRYSSDPNTGYAFQSAAVELAEQINKANGTVYASERFAGEWESIPFLVTREGVNWIQDTGPDTIDAPASLFLWPYGGDTLLPGNLPPGISISGWKGPLIKGDLETSAYPLYWAYSFDKSTIGESLPLAKFSGHIKLVSGTVTHKPASDIKAPAVDELVVTLHWRTDGKPDADYTVFVHIIGPDGLIAQDDSEPADGTLPTKWWTTGMTIVDSHTITMTTSYDPQIDQIRVGLYRNDNLVRLPVLDNNDSPVGDFVTLP